jgi:tRNA threonylcarbamoyladenosine biosynthesis protein TsaE
LPTATRRIVTGSAEGTFRIGEELARGLGPGAVLLVSGDLGAGKTTLLQGVARGLGVPDRVRSPSFTILTRYHGALPFTHVDLYRVRTEAEAAGAGIPDLFEPEGVTAVEWADRLGEVAGPRGAGFPGAIEIAIRIVSETDREIVLRGSEAGLAGLGVTLA